MATQDLLGNDYAVFADVEAADIYLAASADLGEAWAALNATAKARAVISATRLLQTRVNWKDGVPSTDAPVAAVAEANSALAGAIAVKALDTAEGMRQEMLLDELERGDGADALDRVDVVAAAQDAQVDELRHRELGA